MNNTSSTTSVSTIQEALSFDDVLLVPQYSDIMSRSAVDITNELSKNILLGLPVISSPMDTVTEGTMALTMYDAGGMGVIHRYNSISEQTKIVSSVLERNENVPVAAAVGVTKDFMKRCTELKEVGTKVFCLDIAHGHHSMMEVAIKRIKDTFGDSVHIMAGNVATLEAFDALASWGADSVRVGIGGGSICSTRLVAGHGIPTFESVFQCAQTSHNCKLIADGGIKTTGDMVKAFAAGADFVMVGSMLAGTAETPGDVFKNAEGKSYKVYRGMASYNAQKSWRGKSSTPEGISTTIPFKGEVSLILDDIRGGIQSGFSYTGAKNFEEFWAKSKFIRQTNAGQNESFTHILRRDK